MKPYLNIADGEHTSSVPQCYATFVTFNQRSTVSGNPILADRRPIANVEENEFGGIIHGGSLFNAMETTSHSVSRDILSCSVSKSKSSASGSWSMSLAATQDYHALIHPGDYVFIWMRRTISNTPFTNHYNSGLKCWGVVTSSRKVTSVSPEGYRQTRYALSGNDWGKFLETSIYVNSILGEKLQDNMGVVQVFLGAALGDKFGSPTYNLDTLLDAYVGSALQASLLPNPVAATGSGQFQLPKDIVSFFKATGKRSLSGIMQRQFGIAKYSDADPTPIELKELPGFRLIDVQLGNRTPLWSILETYSNPTMNEMFTELRPDASGSLVPTLINRQIPFTSDKAATSPKIPAHTLFSNLPRVRLAEHFIFSEEIGRSESARRNSIHFHGTESVMGAWENTIAIQTARGNFAIDKLSIARHGPYVDLPTSDSDLAHPADPGAGNVSLVTDWIKLYADWHLKGHEHETGTITSIGVEEPVAVGENLEIVRPNGDVELYHIQSYAHSYEVAADGRKAFRTTFSVVRGQRADGKPLYEVG